MTSRRSLITGLISLVAAPAIVRAGSIMPIKAAPIARDIVITETYGEIEHVLIRGYDLYGNPIQQWIPVWRATATKKGFKEITSWSLMTGTT